jgi:hypothetical protein
LRFAHYENKAVELCIADLKNMLRCPPLGVFMDATLNGGSNDTIGSRGRLRRPDISPIFPHQLSPILGTGVVDTGDKFIAGINDNGDH